MFQLHEYASQRIGHELHVYDVPIFSECTLGGHLFDAAWIHAAFANTARLNAEGYAGPLHERHHGDGLDGGGGVRGAGDFVVTRVGPMAVDGGTRETIFATLRFTDPAQAAEAERGAFLWRSIEITPNDFELQRLSSVALLRHEPPWLKFPNMRLRATGGLIQAEAEAGNAKNEAPGEIDSRELVIASEGSAAHAAAAPLLAFCFSERRTMTKRTTPRTVKASEDKQKEEGSTAADSPTVDPAAFAAIVEAVKAKTLTVEQMEQLLGALQEAMGPAEEPEGEPTPGPAEAQDPEEDEERRSLAGVAARAPRAAAPKGKQLQTLAAAEARAVAAEIRAEAAESAQNRASTVEKDLLRFHGRPMGANFRGRLEAAYDRLGPDGYAYFVDELDRTAIGAVGREPRPTAAASESNSGALPEEALAYSDQGERAVVRASEHYARWRELRDRNMHRGRPAAAFVNGAMAREGFRVPTRPSTAS